MRPRGPCKRRCAAPTFTERRIGSTRTCGRCTRSGNLADSACTCYGRILSQPSNVECTTRFPRQVLETLDDNAVDDCAQKVRDLASLAPLVMRGVDPPWNRARITSAGATSDVSIPCGDGARAWPACKPRRLLAGPVTPPQCVDGVSALLCVSDNSGNVE